MKPNPEDTSLPKRLKEFTVKSISANQAPDFQIWDDEDDKYWLALTIKELDPSGAKRFIERTIVESFSAVDYQRMKDDGSGNAHLSQYDKVEVLHDPTQPAATIVQKSVSETVKNKLKPVEGTGTVSGANGVAKPQGTVAAAINQSKEARNNGADNSLPSGAANVGNFTPEAGTATSLAPGGQANANVPPAEPAEKEYKAAVAAYKKKYGSEPAEGATYAEIQDLIK